MYLYFASSIFAQSLSTSGSVLAKLSSCFSPLACMRCAPSQTNAEISRYRNMVMVQIVAMDENVTLISAGRRCRSCHLLNKFTVQPEDVIKKTFFKKFNRCVLFWTHYLTPYFTVWILLSVEVRICTTIFHCSHQIGYRFSLHWALQVT